MYPLFLCALRTGLRQGELIALEWGDIDYRGRFIEVRRNYTKGRMNTPKNGDIRRVDLSMELVGVLRESSGGTRIDSGDGEQGTVRASLS